MWRLVLLCWLCRCQRCSVYLYINQHATTLCQSTPVSPSLPCPLFVLFVHCFSRLAPQMCGSGEGNTAWVYKKANFTPARTKIPKTLLPEAAPTLSVTLVILDSSTHSMGSCVCVYMSANLLLLPSRWCKGAFAIRKSILCTMPPVPKSDAEVRVLKPASIDQRCRLLVFKCFL